MHHWINRKRVAPGTSAAFFSACPITNFSPYREWWLARTCTTIQERRSKPFSLSLAVGNDGKSLVGLTLGKPGLGFPKVNQAGQLLPANVDLTVNGGHLRFRQKAYREGLIRRSTWLDVCTTAEITRFWVQSGFSGLGGSEF